MIAGSVSVAMREVSESVSGLDYMADVGSVLLLGTAGAMCLVVGGLLVAAKRKNRAEFA